MEAIICEVCGQSFKRPGGKTFHERIRHEGRQYPQLWKPGHVTWSKGLKGRHFSPQTEWKQGQRSGPNHPKWKGGRVKGKDGYILVYKPGHPRITHGNYVFEHIIAWEEFHGVPVPEGYVIHHLNGIKDDNRPKNLLAVPKSGHSPSLTVKELQRRLREVEAELAQQRLWDKGGDAK